MYYLDIQDPIINFEQTVNDNIYVDKSLMIDLISNNIKKRSSKYICITRPRRFAPQARRAGRQSMQIGAAHPWRVRCLLYKRV